MLIKYTLNFLGNERGLYMKYTYFKRLLPSILLIFALSLTTIYVDGAQNNTSTTDEELENVQNQIEDAEDKIDEYNEQKESLQGDLDDLNSNLQTLATDMNELESQIANKQQEIKTVTDELEEASQLAMQQYDDMKSRIQFMYEHGNTSLFVTLLECDSLAEFLKRAEYVSFITSYDRAKLNEFQQLQADITEKKETLEAEEASLLALKDEMKQKQSNVTQLISNTQSQIASADENLEDLQKKLEEWEAYEKELEEQKAQEDLEKWEEIQEEGEEDFSDLDYDASEEEAYLLAAIIQCEAEGEPYDGKIAVGNVVMNRVQSSHFPNTITGVIYQEKQFSPVASGRLAYRLEAGVNDECIKAANEVLAGKHITDALFFRTNNGSVEGTVIGNHVFY